MIRNTRLYYIHDIWNIIRSQWRNTFGDDSVPHTYLRKEVVWWNLENPFKWLEFICFLGYMLSYFIDFAIFQITDVWGKQFFFGLYMILKLVIYFPAKLFPFLEKLPLIFIPFILLSNVLAGILLAVWRVSRHILIDLMNGLLSPYTCLIEPLLKVKSHPLKVSLQVLIGLLLATFLILSCTMSLGVPIPALAFMSPFVALITPVTTFLGNIFGFWPAMTTLSICALSVGLTIAQKGFSWLRRLFVDALLSFYDLGEIGVRLCGDVPWLASGNFRLLGKPLIRDLIAEGTLPYSQARGIMRRYGRNGFYFRFGLIPTHRLEDQPIRELLTERAISAEQVMRVPGIINYSSLENASVCALISRGRMTIEQALGLRDEHLTAMARAETFRQLMNGVLPINDFIAQHNVNVAPVLNPPILAVLAQDQRRMNNSQSTHTTSVHRTVTESARKLSERYKDQIEDEKLDAVINEIEGWFNVPREGSQKNTYAEACFLKLKANGHLHTDKSGVTTKQLLAFVWIAIHDEKAIAEQNRTIKAGKEKITLEGARSRFVDGLYEIERGNNLDEKGVDQGGSSDEICPPGAFNKIMQILQGIHPDVNIDFINDETIARKLNAIVKQNALRDINSDKQVANKMSGLIDKAKANGKLTWEEVWEEIKQDGVFEGMWGKINKGVEEEFFKEFKEHYLRKNNPQFVTMLSNGEYVDLGDIICKRFYQKPGPRPGPAVAAAAASSSLYSRTHVI